MLNYRITYKKLKNAFLIPSVFWIVTFFLIPVFLMLIYAFFERGDYGGVKYNFTLINFTLIFDDLYYKIILKTFVVAILNSLLCLLAGYPIAYFISTQKNQSIKNTLLVLVILPFLTNFLIRTYAWMVLLGNEGLINTILFNLKIIDNPLQLLFTPFAVQLGLFYNYLPFIILPLYSSIEKINKNLYLASNDLGGSNLKTFLNVTLPLSKSGIFTGLFLVFIPTLGEFIIPDILGGSKSVMIGNIVKDQFLTARNWPFGSALVFIIMFALLIVMSAKNIITKYNAK